MNNSFTHNCAKCPELVEWIEWTILICKKGNRPYMPSYPELHKYCKSINHDNCPYLKTASALKSDDYTALLKKKLN